MNHPILKKKPGGTGQLAYFHGLSEEEKIQAFQEMVDECQRIVFFGGAGTSTECGIPDFRSADGLYNTVDAQFDQYEPEYLLSHTCLYHNPKVFFEFYRQKLNFNDAKPVYMHYVLADWERQGKLSAIVTQNIDGIHQKAGSKTVYEIHGTAEICHCTKCGKRFTSDSIFGTKEKIPHCDCGGMIRPDIVLYEESLPKKEWNSSVKAIENADMLIIAGTSLSVYPAAGLTMDFSGKYMVLLNMQEGPMDQNCDLVFHEPMGEIFKHF